MGKTKKYRWLRIVVFTLLFLIIGAGGWVVWLSRHYKSILFKQIPEIIASSSDSLYQVRFSDIDVSYFDHNVTITNLSLWADTARAAEMRRNKRHIPTTLSSVTIPEMRISGVIWKDLATRHTFDCDQVTIQGIKWQLTAVPHPEDSLFSRGKKGKPFLERFAAKTLVAERADVTYWYKGKSDTFRCMMKGGKTTLHNWAYNFDDSRDTAVFLYAYQGSVSLDSFIFHKAIGRYGVKDMKLDFEAKNEEVTLQHIRMKNMTNHDPRSGALKEVYDLTFPAIALRGFNWNKLIDDNTLAAREVLATKPNINIRYFRAADPGGSKVGSYPQQLLLQVAIQTNIHQLDINDGHFGYTEITTKEKEATLDFSRINASFYNVTNVDSLIALHNTCDIRLKGVFMHKSDVEMNFNLWLTDRKGRFRLDGMLKNLDGDEVIEQTRALSIVEVTSFHLSQMDIHEEGDETYSKGDFTVKYDGLKISLLKFKSNHRKGKKGPLSFLGSALLLYPSNPMPGAEVRRVTTSFARDPNKGFVNTVWQHMYRAARKTAMRNETLLTLTDGKETKKGETPRKGFLKRLFGKKNKG